MNRLSAIAELAALPGPVALAIGVFDGLHLGHQEVIRRALDYAKRNGGSAVVVTFEPHPIRLLRPERAPQLLAALPHKEQLLADFGVEHLLVIDFDEKFAAKTAEEFIGELASTAHPLGLISVGRGWRFGNGGTGNIDLLQALGEQHQFTVEGIAPITEGTEAVSSTRVRSAVTAGDFETARTLLGREYTVLGTVERGDQLGRQIGCPTANLQVHSEQLPPNGVYAVVAKLRGTPYPGVANLGLRPTVEKGRTRPRLEVHLLEVDEEFYGEELEVTFHQHLRKELKFKSVDALKEQIAKDMRNARELFSA